MGATTLVGPDIDGAERLVKMLEAEGVPVVAAFWLHPTEEAGWRFVIASPTVPTEGALPIYRRVQDALQRMPNIQIGLDGMFVVSATDPLISELRSAIPSGYPIQGSDVTIPVRNYAPYLPDNAATATLYIHRLNQSDTHAGQVRGPDEGAEGVV